MWKWVKDSTAVAWVSVEALVQSLTHYSGLKDLALPQLWLRFTPWPGNFHVLRVKNKTQKTVHFQEFPSWLSG